MKNPLEWLKQSPATPQWHWLDQARARQSTLTKPAGALGRLEELALWLAARQGCLLPQAEHIHIVVFAADHGVTAQGVSAFPQCVTRQMLANFASGGAAICVLAQALQAELTIINVGTAGEAEVIDGVIDHSLGLGSADLSQQPAMSQHQLAAAINIGRQAVLNASASDIFIGGDMGIGNTTAATAMACALLALPAECLAGPGSGLAASGVAHKTSIVRRALAQHRSQLTSALAITRHLGGFEIAALVGAYITCAQIGMPALIDGYISSVAALTATRLCADAQQWFLYSHQSAEPGHQTILEALAAQPLLNLGLRLGEASGAAVAVPLLRLACMLHRQMATFDQAGIATGSSRA